MTLKGHAERRVLFCTFSESTKAVLRFGFVRDGSFSARRSLGRLSLHAVRLRRKDRQREEKTEVFCQTFVHKSLWVSKGQSPLGARRNERNVLSVKAHLRVNFSIQVLD